ncbi:hypothetical protein WJX72_010206 [[Myrmecia] bisecta]|uniref:Glucose-methanol-choline oxidoreductase N-terminal domain-containing protein n=1 Tax=[Myrmecia] bisecta TaxID=41462 RepID=A0AAW1QSH1_9CHLO
MTSDRPRLARPVTKIAAAYQVLVLGTGYGGATAACRLAAAGLQTCVLEKGREFGPQDFTKTPKDNWRNTQVHAGGALSTVVRALTALGKLGKHDALYDWRVDGDIIVYQGCGLGGGSLINAGVAVRPASGVLAGHEWPAELQKAVTDDNPYGALASGYAAAEAMLGAAPQNDAALPRHAPLTSLAKAHDTALVSPKLTISQADGVSTAGVAMGRCRNCGNCGSGCSYGAKASLDTNYLASAVAHGAHIFTQVAVSHIVKRADEEWDVFYTSSSLEGRSRFGAPLLVVRAKTVVIAAGSLGSTQILLESARRGLPLSPTVGQGFSANGDFAGVSFNGSIPLGQLGASLAPSSKDKHACQPGPLISSLVELSDETRSSEKGMKNMMVQESNFDAMLATIFFWMCLLVWLGQHVLAAEVCTPRRSWRQWFSHIGRVISSLSSGVRAPHSAMQHSQLAFVVGHDNADGSIEAYDAGGYLGLAGQKAVRVHWPDHARQFQAAENALAVKANGLHTVCLEAIVTVCIADMASFLASRRHRAAFTGTVLAEALDPEPMMATGGTFELFTAKTLSHGPVLARYTCELTAR